MRFTYLRFFWCSDLYRYYDTANLRTFPRMLLIYWEASGAKMFGNIVIGDNVEIGANRVGTWDIPDNAVVVGVPRRIISYR